MIIPISKDFAQKLIDYMGTQPYKEVCFLIQELMLAAQSAEQEAAEKKVTEKAEKNES